MKSTPTLGARRVGLLAEHAGHFQGHGHGAGPVGGAVHGGVFLHLVVVGKGPGVPVAEDGHAPRRRGLVLRNDVAGVDVGAVKRHGLEGLLHHLQAVAFELGHQPVAAGAVGLGVGHARPKRHLLGREGVGRVGVEHRGFGQLGCGRGAGVGGFGGLVLSGQPVSRTGGGQGGQGKARKFMS